MFRLFTTVYSILYTCSLLLYLPVLLYDVILKRRARTNLLQRAGQVSRVVRTAPSPGTPKVWIHAVSVGEVSAMQTFVNRLELARDQLWISTITSTGQALARRLFDDRAHVFYFPLDWTWSSRRHLKAIRPSVVLLMETEIWPGFISAAQSLSIPLLLINGRISDASFRRYRLVRFFMKPLLERVDHFCMQSRLDKERILELGASAEKVHQVGNLKYDYELPDDPEKLELTETVRGLLRAEEQDLLWICGSTEEGEEEILLNTFIALRHEFPLRLILAPRQPHRSDRVVSLVESRGIRCLKRSDLSVGLTEARSSDRRPEVFILDSIGEIAYLYQLADVVFVGGSLVAAGGHNLIEAAYLAKPILFGPHMENFREISDSFLDSYASLQVRSGTELTDRIRDLLKDPATRSWLGRNARKVVRDNQGALQRTVEFVRQYVGKNNRAR